MSAYVDSSKSNKRRIGVILGVVFGCGGGLLIICSVVYLWWRKKEPEDMKIHSESPRKD